MKRLETEIHSDYQGEEKRRRDEAISRYVGGRPLTPADNIELAITSGLVVDEITLSKAQDPRHTWDTVSATAPQPEKPPVKKPSIIQNVRKIINL